MRRALGLALLVALSLPGGVRAKEFTSVVAVGADGRSVEFRIRPAVIDGFFDLRGRPPVRARPLGPYVRLFVLDAGGFVGVPGRLYARTAAACFDWDQSRDPRGACPRLTRALVRLLAPARRLAPFRGNPTTLARLAQPRLPNGVRLQLRVAVDLAFGASDRAYPAPRPSRCIPFSAVWRGPSAATRPRRFCLSPRGIHAGGRLYPLGRSVYSYASLNLVR